MAMVYFLSADGGTKVSLDSESSVTVSLPSTVTKSSISSGKSVSHNVIEGNATISVSGLVTYSKSKLQEDNLDPIELQKELQKARRDSRKFTLYLSEVDELPLLLDYKDCVIADVQVIAEKYSNAVRMEITFEQVFISEAAKKAYLKPKSNPANAATTNGSSDSGQGTKSKAKEKESKTIYKSMADGTYNLFAPAE